jgi:hypothetical protein
LPTDAAIYAAAVPLSEQISLPVLSAESLGSSDMVFLSVTPIQDLIEPF